MVLLLNDVVGILELEVAEIGKASRRKKLRLNYGKPGSEKEKREQRKSPLEEALEEAVEETDLGYEEDEDEYEEVIGIYAEMKEKGMTLDEFRERFVGELEVVEIGQIEIAWGGLDIETSKYKGLGLIIRHQLEEDCQLFPFSDAENPKAKVPSEVFDYLSSL